MTVAERKHLSMLLKESRKLLLTALDAAKEKGMSPRSFEEGVDHVVAVFLNEIEVGLVTGASSQLIASQESEPPDADSASEASDLGSDIEFRSFRDRRVGWSD